MFRSVLSLVFPGTCLGCGSGPSPWCPACLEGVARLTLPGCHRCGRPFQEWVPGCADCPPRPIAWSRAAFLYQGPVRNALMKLKFAGLRSAAEGMAPFMLEALARAPPWSTGPPERAVVTWVPLGRRRRRSRGYDQAEALAKAVGRLSGWAVAPLLERASETDPQARRSGRERREALQGAFRSRARAPSRVILVDDVLTSGATAAECVRALLETGASEVGVLTAARSLGGPVPARCYNPAGFQPGSVVARETFSR